MNLRSLVPSLLLGAALFTGCDEHVDAVDGEVSLRPGSGSSGGVWLNTSTIGTTPFSELDLKGNVHDGVQFTGAKVLRPGNVWLTVVEGSVMDGNLKAKASNGVTYSGADLIGSHWYLTLSNADTDHDGDHDADDAASVPTEIWISAHQQVSPRESRYVFETFDDDGNAVPVCDADSSGNRTAIPIKDVTVDDFTGDMAPRKDTLYLACTSGAIGKAITWGYRPWERPLPEFEVATRMVRADYCFDGMSWTETGMPIQVKDKYGTNTFLYATDPTEVVWTKTGAACINTPRNLTYAASQVTCNGAALPTCAGNVGMTTYKDTLFWTKIDATDP